MTPVFKQGSSHGLWVCVLLPINLWLAHFQTHVVLFNLATLMISLNLAYKVLLLNNSSSWKKWILQGLISDLFERECSKVVRMTREISKRTQVPPKLIPETLEEARRMREFQLLAPASLKSVKDGEEKPSKLSYPHKRQDFVIFMHFSSHNLLIICKIT